MINCPSVKHQSNVYFEFTGVDGNMKKLIKQVAEVHSLRKLVDDISDKQIMEKLTHCEE